MGNQATSQALNLRIRGSCTVWVLKNANKSYTVVPKDYWDKKNLPDMGPLQINSIHIRGLLFEKFNIF